MQVCIWLHLVKYPWHSCQRHHISNSCDMIDRLDVLILFSELNPLATSAVLTLIVNISLTSSKIDSMESGAIFRSIDNPSNTSLEDWTVLDFQTTDLLGSSTQKSYFTFHLGKKKQTLKYYTCFFMSSSPYDTGLTFPWAIVWCQIPCTEAKEGQRILRIFQLDI